MAFLSGKIVHIAQEFVNNLEDVSIVHVAKRFGKLWGRAVLTEPEGLDQVKKIVYKSFKIDSTKVE